MRKYIAIILLVLSSCKGFLEETPTTSLSEDSVYDSPQALEANINGCYLSLNNISLGYTLPKTLLAKAGISKIRVYAVADNVYLWSARKGLDPRQSVTGDSNPRYYSPVRSISGGVQLSF